MLEYLMILMRSMIDIHYTHVTFYNTVMLFTGRLQMKQSGIEIK